MRLVAGTVRAEPLRQGWFRLVIKSGTGEEIGCDLSPEAAADLAAVLPRPVSNPAAPASRRRGRKE